MFPKLNVLPFIAFILFSISSISQPLDDSKIDAISDSLLTRIEKNLVDSNDIHYFNKNANVFANHNPQRSLKIITSYLALKLFADSSAEVGTLKNQLGRIYRDQGLNELAIANFLASANVYRQFKMDIGLSYTLIDIGNIFYDLKLYDEAERYYNQVIQLDSIPYYSPATAVAFNNLGLIKQSKKDYPSGIQYFREGLEIRKRVATPDLIAHSYHHLFQIFLLLEEYDSAEVQLSRSLDWLKELDSSIPEYNQRIWEYRYNRALLAFNKKQYGSAHMLADSARIQSISYRSIQHQIKALVLESKACVYMNKLDMARSEVMEAYNIADKSGILPLKIDILKAWIAVEKKLNNTAEVVRLQDSLIATENQLFNERQSINIATNIYRDELERAESESIKERARRISSEEELRSKNQMNRLLSILLATVVLFTGLNIYMIVHISKKRKKSTENNKVISQQKAKIEEANKLLENNNRLLARAVQQNTIFMSKMSHEIRTPLNAIHGLSELLLNENFDPNHTQSIRNIHTSAQRLISLFNDIQDYSKLDGGQVRLKPQHFNLKEFVDDLRELFKLKATANGTLIHLEIDPDVPNYIVCDKNRLGQVMSNLLSNAIKFTEGGHIYLRIQNVPDQAFIKFEVEDTGIGISREHLSKIFEEFRQAHEEIHNQYGGTGLGLAISKQLIELMKGSIKVESKLGRGSIFSFTIPMIDSDQNATVNNHEYAALRGKSILLVEDDKMNQFVAKKMLSKVEVKLEIANHGEEAVDYCLIHHYDLILMDVQMPIMNGLEATQLIRQKGLNTSTPIIALTADIQDVTKEKALNAGMNGVLTKPFNRSSLLDTVLAMTKS